MFGEVAVLIRCERAHSVRASPDGPARLAVIDRDMFRAVNEYLLRQLRHTHARRLPPTTNPVKNLNQNKSKTKENKSRTGIHVAS